MTTSPSKVQIFSSYSHDDKTIVADVIKFIRSDVGKAGGFIWIDDEQITTGDNWENAIKEQLAISDIVLAFVSQAFLDDTRYTAKEVEIALERRKAEGIIIFPVILSPCSWKDHPWLVDTHALPPQKTLREYIGSSRERQLLAISDHLVTQVKKVIELCSMREMTIGVPKQGAFVHKVINHTIQLSAGQTITVELQAPRYGAFLELLNPNRASVKSMEVKKRYIDTTCYGVFTYTTRIGGLYTIRVSQGTGEYTLEVWDSSVGRVHGTIELNKPINATLAPREFHRWRLNLPAPQKIIIEAETNDLTADLELWAINKTTADLPYQDKTDEAGHRLSCRGEIKPLTPLQSGIYMVSVISGKGTDYQLVVREAP